jgi:hypothetical protein
VFDGTTDPHHRHVVLYLPPIGEERTGLLLKVSVYSLNQDSDLHLNLGGEFPRLVASGIELRLVPPCHKLLNKKDIGIKVVGATSDAAKELFPILIDILVLDECEHILVEVEKGTLRVPEDNPHTERTRGVSKPLAERQ